MPERTGDRDRDMLDAYSQSVIGVVEAVGPAVASLRVDRFLSSRWRRLPLRGAAAGFFIDPDGWMLTNWHVVRRAHRVEARLPGGGRLAMHVIGTDPGTDLALLRADERGLPYVQLAADDDVRVGQLVVAIGDPLGFRASVSAGVVSATDRRMRTIGGRVLEHVLQHTAALNPGNSGGPLLDSAGRVVGINTAIIAMAQSIGFAIPAGTARWVADELRRHGRVRRGGLGVVLGMLPAPPGLPVWRDRAEPGGRVPTVISVLPHTPAREALRVGDVLLDVGGRPVHDLREARRLLENRPVGTSLRLKVFRKDDEISCELTTVEL